jgi:hypothetical protein
MHWIQTFSGKQFDLLDPQPDMICIEDIAHALGNMPRFTGHTRVFYSVAQHSIQVSNLVNSEHAFVGLMHDAPEAYIGDMSSPLKGLLRDYRRIERVIWLAIADKFGLPDDIPSEVKGADQIALRTERDELMGVPPAPWGALEEVPRHGSPLVPRHARLAELMFLERFASCTKTATA